MQNLPEKTDQFSLRVKEKETFLVGPAFEIRVDADQLAAQFIWQDRFYIFLHSTASLDESVGVYLATRDLILDYANSTLPGLQGPPQGFVPVGAGKISFAFPKSTRWLLSDFGRARFAFFHPWQIWLHQHSFSRQFSLVRT